MDAQITTIEKVKKGDFFRPLKVKKVYIQKGYDRMNKKYEVQDFNDISNFKYLKKGTKVIIGFTF